MAFVIPDEWLPIGIDFLEPAAKKALRYPGNTCVVAGPGAGKTEFLAQRAAYLLQTGTCPPPFQILAISFKRDAAENLAKRVRQRCLPEQAARFISITFDTFTKGLVDRFHTALPAYCRPVYPYEIIFPNTTYISNFLASARIKSQASWHREIMGISETKFESHTIGTHKLALRESEPSSGTEFAIHMWLMDHLLAKQHSKITFTMLNRLAELILRANAQIVRALRTTYPFVFVDEFQDTTYAQYDFLQSAFGTGRTTVTTVGDDKQRIMEWAGARADAFVSYKNDFNAEQFKLLANFRSSPDLVRIQHVVACALDTDVNESQSYALQAIDQNSAQIWLHNSDVTEAPQIAKWLVEDMQQRGTSPRDYVLLVRQTADRFETQLAEPFKQVGLRLRNESRTVGKLSLQDLLTEELIQIGVALLRLGSQRKAPEAWDKASKAIQNLQVADLNDEVACHKAENNLTAFLKELRVFMAANIPTAETAQQLTERLLAFLDLVAVARTYIEYGSGDTLALAAESFCLHLQGSAVESDDWNSCLDIFEGVDQVPLMTVHKSKGLEFDTMVFVGLDDKAWWSYSSDNPEGIATFFVALSRAKQRAIFTYCQTRGARKKVKDLYDLLAEAGVPEFHY